MGVESTCVEIEVVGWLVFESLRALKRVQLQVAELALLGDVIERTQDDKDRDGRSESEHSILEVGNIKLCLLFDSIGLLNFLHELLGERVGRHNQG